MAYMKSPSGDRPNGRGVWGRAPFKGSPVMWTFLVGDTDKSGWCGLPEERAYGALLFFSSTKNKYQRIKLS